jgi:ABC-2 type transport system ATP-binding protein
MLEIQNLHKNYGTRSVLCGLDLSIKSGEIYGLLGPNGSGKTTTINLICNLLKADAGSITINQKRSGESDKSILGIVPQENLLYKSLTCQENLSFYADIYGLIGRRKNQQIKQALEWVNLLDRANHRVENLSGGLQRRLNIAISLIHRPKLLILDEPTTGLDIESRYEVWLLLQKLNQQGMTILLTTHLLDEAERLCNRIGIIKSGRIIAQGSLEELRLLVPAKEIVFIKVKEEAEAIELIKELGWTYRYYRRELAILLPQALELREILNYFDGLSVDSVSRQFVSLENIYLEVINQSNSFHK